jgi:hypothetical protein
MNTTKTDLELSFDAFIGGCPPELRVRIERDLLVFKQLYYGGAAAAGMVITGEETYAKGVEKLHEQMQTIIDSEARKASQRN